MVEYTCVIDGGARGNPGEAGCGIFIKSKTEIHKLYFYLGRKSNNQAEYAGLLNCLKKLIKLEADNIVIYSDSELLVNHINGSYECKSPILRPLYVESKKLINNFKEIKLIHRPRKYTQVADTLANLAMDTKGSKEITYPNLKNDFI